MDADLLTPDDLARLLNVSIRTLHRWHDERVGPPRIKIGRQIYYREQSVRDWLAANEKDEPRAARG